jgi:hypothetical protein
MNSRNFAIAIYATFAMGLASIGIYTSFDGPHGGVVKDAGRYKIEMTSLPTHFSTYLLDNASQPISNKGLTCKAQFIFADSTSVDAELMPLGSDGFETKSLVGYFHSCRVTFIAKGESISAVFENEGVMVKKEGKK